VSVLGATRLLAYRRRASPLHATRGPIVGAYGGALALAALLSENPLLLGALLGCVLLAAAGAGVGRRLMLAARASVLPVLVLSVIVNALVSRGGLTVFARLGDWGVLGQVNLTLEAVVYGLVFGLRLMVVALACMLVVCAADPDELLMALRRISPRSALTAALSTRLVGVLGQDAHRLAQAQRARPGHSGRGTRARLAVLRAAVASALDRSLDVAAVLEMRGYGACGRRRGAVGPLSRHDIGFAVSAVAVIAIALLGLIGGAGGFHAYPLIRISHSAGTLALAVALLAAALLPFADRRGIEP
jgi:energy-coupling factor transport system permease protein